LQRSSTIENVQRKQALTPVEREQEEESEIVNDDSDEEEDDGTVYNPKNLPLGWDGKVFFIFGSFEAQPTNRTLILLKCFNNNNK
jgi:hypothetical protein